MMRSVYKKMPGSIKRVVEIVWGSCPLWIKYGSGYVKNERYLKKSQWWSREKLMQYQLEDLRALCIHAYKNVPYYRKIFDKYQFNPNKITAFSDIERLPLMDKDIVEENFKDLIATNIPKRKWKIQTTGGTTGKQLRFLTEKNIYAKREYPYVNAIWGRVGYKRDRSRVGVLRNQTFEKGLLYKYDYKTKSYIFDSYHLTGHNIQLILEKIAELKLEYLHTYPSAVLILCEYIKSHGIKYENSLKAVLATSENIYPGQQELIETTLGCRLFSFYGHSECAAIAGWCEKSNLYHVNTEYGYLELIDENNNVIQETGKRGEIVCTGFGNRLMPLIRYKTGDYSSWAENQYCECNRNYPLLNIVEGRWTQEMFFGKWGNKISMTALNMHSDIFKNVENYQFEQCKIGECILRIKKGKEYTTLDERKIKKALDEKFDHSINILFEYVECIERTIRGKQRYIIQKVRNDTSET